MYIYYLKLQIVTRLVAHLKSEVIIIRKWLKAFREEKGYTQTQVAEKIGISSQMYCLIENGKRCESSKNDTEKKIAAELGFDWTRFFEEPDPISDS